MDKDKIVSYCPCCGEVMTFPLGTRVVIVDNFDEHIGYKQGTICKIVEITDDGFYVLDNGYWCSEAEIKEVK